MAQPSDQHPTNQPSVPQHRTLIIIAVVVALLAMLIAYVLITTPKLPDWTGFNSKTVWDVLDLFGAPLALAIIAAIIAYLFSQAQKRYELEIAAENRAGDQKIAAQNREADLAIAVSRDNEAALQSYFDRMTDLLLIHKMKQPDKLAKEAKNVAQGRTLNILQRLDGERKGHIIQFLYSAELIRTPQPHINLKHADLRNAVLSNPQVELSGANYQGVHLANTDLRGAFLSAAVLQNADMRQADLRNAQLQNAVLRDTILEEANLNEAKLNFAVAAGANLQRAQLRIADLSGANFSNANLAGADLSYAVLDSTDFTGANLTGAILTGVDLTEAITDSQTKLPEAARPLSSTSDQAETEP